MSSKFVFLESMDILSTIPQYHTILVAFTVLWIAWFFAKRRYQSEDNTADEFERRLEQWTPEPLVPEVQKDHPFLNPKKVTSRIGKRINVNGHDCLNLGTHNYLGLTENADIEKKAVDSIQKYGVGSCGPRGFYGTVDVHLELEERLAQFMQMEEAIVYSYGFSTIASAIPAYCKRNDLVFVDEQVNFSIQKGLDAARSNIKYFKHNDVKDLENLLETYVGSTKVKSNKVERRRKFLIVEGIYMNTGMVCPLPQLVALSRKYKLRIFVDESISIGTVGATGRGVTEHFNVPRHEIDMIMGSLELTIGSIGGFCVGSSFVIEHQRLSGLGYCFSASLPPLLTSAAIASLEIMENKPELFSALKNNCMKFDEGIKNINLFECTSDSESPVKHLYLKEQMDHNKELKLLQEISNKCIENGLMVITPAYLDAEKKRPRPSLRVCISAALDTNDINFALTTLKSCATQILSYSVQ
ncbi:serine palmitoyltransferase 1 [Copidosoma floridanum]|uniref:serine palmitoyltransferase 1 n=1 Tax=Copidosoma floridanum TaxID=29053 RepID=UPI0006C96305|nr:serine palmitoyltransferase 1 [Copidosoma floridanum]